MKTERSAEKTTRKYMRIKEVMAMCAMSGSAISGAIKKGQFPAQVKLSERTSVWVQSEVASWGEARIKAAREARRST